jgi:hypothetical protein
MTGDFFAPYYRRPAPSPSLPEGRWHYVVMTEEFFVVSSRNYSVVEQANNPSFRAKLYQPPFRHFEQRREIFCEANTPTLLLSLPHLISTLNSQLLILNIQPCHSARSTLPHLVILSVAEESRRSRTKASPIGEAVAKRLMRFPSLTKRVSRSRNENATGDFFAPNSRRLSITNTPHLKIPRLFLP